MWIIWLCVHNPIVVFFPIGNCKALVFFRQRIDLSIIFIMKNFLTKLDLMVFFFFFTLDGFFQRKIRCLDFSYLPIYLLNISKLSYAYIITQKWKMFIFISLLSFCVHNSYYLCIFFSSSDIRARLFFRWFLVLIKWKNEVYLISWCIFFFVLIICLFRCKPY